MYSYKGFMIPRDAGLLCSVFFFLIYYSLMLKLLPVQKILSPGPQNIPARGRKAGLPGSSEVVLDKIYRASTFFLKRVWRTEKPCLKRALALRRWCLRSGIECGMVIGVNKSEGILKSHAWLEIDSVPFREDPEILSTYTPIMGG